MAHPAMLDNEFENEQDALVSAKGYIEQFSDSPDPVVRQAVKLIRALVAMLWIQSRKV